MPPFLREHSTGVFLSVKAQPRAAMDEIADAIGSELKIKITAPPVDSAANEALIRFIARELGCARNSVRLVRGNTSRHKVFFIDGITVEEAESRLNHSIGPRKKR